MTLMYQAPLRDMRFVIDEWIDAASWWPEVPDWADLDQAAAQQVLEESARFVEERIAPLNASADLEGCRFEAGKVSMPAGFRESYAAYVEAGWPTLSLDTECGGQGLPQLLDVALQEMLAGANHAWLMSPGLTHGAVACLQAHGSERIKRELLPQVASGAWLTTMCITEPQAGSDLALIRTRAIPAPQNDGYFVDGSKIFISGGAHDLTENIVHLILARLPDAAPGTKGLSLFVVPAWLESERGERERNGVYCEGIEKKLGLKGSPTCSMRFERALGWLVGEPGRGLACLFVMMNAARLQVAMQGLGHAHTAWQRAHTYALERVQMRAVSTPPDVPDEPGRAVPIAWHPAIRRALMELRAIAEGERAIGYWTAHWLDVAARHSDSLAREEAGQLASLLTPVAKAFFTENGFAAASNALQVFGGYGYIHEYGIEQTLRDSRVAMIYEGTNEIQAIDLLVRKVLPDISAGLGVLLRHIREEAQLCDSGEVQVRAVGLRLTELVDDVERVTYAIKEHQAADPEAAYRVADDYLAMLGWMLLSFAWARTLRISTSVDRGDPFYAEKCETAHFFFEYPLAAFAYRRALVEAGWSARLPHIAS
ncbi:acyl-CoA dehydrogenase family protein [Burkholderia lata]|uniref:Acyl-CoA dehydrogenase n=1 Tax=Burkholderia lata (strain ATCC 17760 / DSM 23089 / LMG 22485 / NCIMB 9086 / R18194 / 383) TaxID=482957 RepID=A0A6P2QBY6_BURL3|nr:acyl-CoA dehydrogenase family protein [Burkholderia lata]VWC16768.1 acyl-CoA dehydrogenase [Burkholderia lata]